MLSEREVTAAVGSTAYGVDGDKLGTVEHFFVDDRTGQPTWVTVSTGLFGTRHSIVPAVDATFADGALRIPVTAGAVKDAPHLAGDHLDPAEEDELRRHYGLGSGVSAPAGSVASDDTVEVAAAAPLPPPDTVGRHRAQPDAEPADEPDADPDADPAGEPEDGAMTRSEEQLRVGTETVAMTRARLVKYVVTEEVQVTVPIRREEIRVEQVPLDADLDTDVADWAGESLETTPRPVGGLPDEIVLHAERPVVSVEVVPVERVRLRTELVEGQETVTGQVQREQIVVDRDPGISPR